MLIRRISATLPPPSDLDGGGSKHTYSHEELFNQ